jgi:CheY-like chemotaxis protein
MSDSPFTVLIADDDLDDQGLIKNALNSLQKDFKMITLSNGIQLIDYLLKRHSYKDNTDTPNLVLLDLNMPVMDGFDVLQEIRKHQHLQQLPVYVITVSRNTDELNKALDLGANGFYSKGSSASEIVQIITEVYGKCLNQISDN